MFGINLSGWLLTTFLLVTFCLSFQAVEAQVELKQQAKFGVPNFEYEIINVRSNEIDLSRLNIFIQIAYDDLQFVKADTGYQAEYEVTVSINDKDGEQAEGKIWSELILVNEYEQTNERAKYSFTTASFHVPPEKYEVIIHLMDKDSKITSVKKREIEVRDFSRKKLNVSDITLVSNLTIDSLGIKSIRPLISSNIHESLEKLFAYFEIYSQEDVAEFEVSYEVKFYNGKKIAQDKFKISKKDERTMYAVTLDAKNMSSGKYTLFLKVKDGSHSMSVDKTFFLRWRGLPHSVFDLDAAIEQMKYIASGSELGKMRKAKGKEKGELFQKFWTKRDPTPGTEENEHMEEYFRRVHYANEAFSGFREGWRSDMGMVYIILGHPNDIERHPFESGSKPYQVWYYYEINRQFVFVDETGFGEYRLLSQYWDDLFREYGRGY